MAVRLAALAALWHMAEHVDVARRVVPQLAAADRRVFGKSLADEVLVFQELRQLLRDVGQAAFAFALERRRQIGAEFGERVWHGHLLQSMIRKSASRFSDKIMRLKMLQFLSAPTSALYRAMTSCGVAAAWAMDLSTVSPSMGLISMPSFSASSRTAGSRHIAMKASCSA